MEFNLYDVLEVEGHRYVITEKIKYMEIKPKGKKEEAYYESMYRRKPPGDYWHEYGLKAVEGNDEIWVTIEFDDNEWCSVSRPSGRTSAGQGFSLHQIGLEKVVAVDGDSGASVGDRAGYKEYRRQSEKGIATFFEENWFEGQKLFSKGERVPLQQIRLCNDAAAVKIKKSYSRARLKKRISNGAAGILYGFIIMCFIFSFDNDFSWHGIRSTFGFPYTIEEHMNDTSIYYEKTDVDGANVYVSKLDPVSTAIELIDSVDGDIRLEGEYLEEGHEIIAIYAKDLVYIITNEGTTTRVKISKLNQESKEDDALIQKALRNNHILGTYATLIRLKDNKGRDTLFNMNSPEMNIQTKR